MNEIKRDPEQYSKQSFDLIIVGGGIYGAMLAYEAVRRSLKPLVVEQNDFTSATSLNHLRTVHGGLRYLQSLDFPRFMESIGERRWFLRHFPQFVIPMPCMMPLYGKGLHRPFILKVALMMNDLLSINRNKGAREDRHLPSGRVISPDETKELFPMVDTDGLKGSAVWYDGAIQEFQRLVMELIKASTRRGAIFLNYMKAVELLKSDGNAAGIKAEDKENGAVFEFNAPVVINAAGPGSRDIADLFDKDHVPLFRQRLLLWNILFKREALSEYALGLALNKGEGRSYFFHPWKNRLLIGTGELVVEKSDSETRVPPAAMDEFIAAVNEMAPGLNVTQKDIQRVYSGILPATDSGKLSKREVIFDHSAQGGPKGLYSLSGIKFTTARLVAEKTMKRIFNNNPSVSHQDMLQNVQAMAFDYNWEPENEADIKRLKEIIENESVLHLSDLILRRTSLGDHPERAIKVLSKLKPLFSWDNTRWKQESDALHLELTNQ